MPESVLESVLHARSVAMDEFVKQMRTGSVISKKSTMQCSRDVACNKIRPESPQCFSVSSSDRELSPGSTATAECSSPAAACCASIL